MSLACDALRGRFEHNFRHLPSLNPLSPRQYRHCILVGALISHPSAHSLKMIIVMTLLNVSVFSRALHPSTIFFAITSSAWRMSIAFLTMITHSRSRLWACIRFKFTSAINPPPSCSGHQITIRARVQSRLAERAHVLRTRKFHPIAKRVLENSPSIHVSIADQRRSAKAVSLIKTRRSHCSPLKLCKFIEALQSSAKLPSGIKRTRTCIHPFLHREKFPSTLLANHMFEDHLTSLYCRETVCNANLEGSSTYFQITFDPPRS